MENTVVRAKARDVSGKGYARKIRALGYLPAVVYGGNGDARSIVVDPKVVTDILNGATGRNTVIHLEIEDAANPETTQAVIRDFAIHPVKRNLEHCDFLRVDDSTELVVKVPVRTIGKSEGEKLGARLNIAMRQVTLRCKAGEVPESIVIDISAFKVGQVMTLSQLPVGPGVRPVFVKDNAVVTVRMPRAEKGAEGEAEEAAATPGAAAPAAAAPKAE
jgi:large subunit ribosomal protein L25